MGQLCQPDPPLQLPDGAYVDLEESPVISRIKLAAELSKLKHDKRQGCYDGKAMVEEGETRCILEFI